MARIIVVGAGVIGLTCAVRLLEEGHRVDVLARDLPLETTSVVAAALWYPYRALPPERVTAWAGASYRRFAELADHAPGADRGVRMLRGTEQLTTVRPDPWWRDAVPQLDRVPPQSGFADAWSFVAPVVDMPHYLVWLRARLHSLGGTLTRENLSHLPRGADLVVNCAGLGARHLGDDPDVRPVQGQVVVVEQFGLDHWALDDAGPTYLVPRRDEVVIGGTAVEDAWSRTPSEAVAAEILRRAARLVPEAARARVLRHKVGLRPTRPAVRVEREGHVVHCYGHGGAGVTLSWGVADDVVRLAG